MSLLYFSLTLLNTFIKVKCKYEMSKNLYLLIYILLLSNIYSHNLDN